jgi:hypothetical protein
MEFSQQCTWHESEDRGKKDDRKKCARCQIYIFILGVHLRNVGEIIPGELGSVAGRVHSQVVPIDGGRGGVDHTLDNSCSVVRRQHVFRARGHVRRDRARYI